MDIQSLWLSSECGSLILARGSSVWHRSGYVETLPIGGMDDGWTMDLRDEGPQTERVLELIRAWQVS